MMLTTKASSFFYLLGILCFGSFISPCVAEERWQVVILPDASADSPIELSELHNIIAQRLTLALSAADFDVHSPQYLGLPNCTIEDCTGLTDQHIRQQAMVSGKDINLALLYKINLTKQTERNVDSWNFMLSGRLLDLENGTEQDAFILDNHLKKIEKNCFGQCFRNRLEQHAGLMAQELGAILSEKLASLSRRFTYLFELRNFTAGELNEIDSFLKELDTYIADNLQREFDAKAQWLHQVSSREYRYVSEHSSSELGRKLQTFLSEQGISAKLLYENEQDLFTLTRVGTPYLAVYLATIFIVVLLLLILIMRLRKHQYETKIIQARNHVAQAKILIQQHNYKAAETQLTSALALQSHDTEALVLQGQIASYQRADEYLQIAQTEMAQDPAKALSYLRQAKQLDPQLTELILPLEQQCVDALGTQSEITSTTQFTSDTLKDDELAAPPTPVAAFHQSHWLLLSVLVLVILFTSYWYYDSKQEQTVVIELLQDQQKLEEQANVSSTPMDDNLPQELSAWYQAKELNSIGSYQRYLHEWPQGQYAVYAKQVLNFRKEDRNAWQSAQQSDDIVAYQHYLDLKPMGEFAELAHEKLIGHLAEQAKAHALQRLMALADESYFEQKDDEQAFYYYQQAANQGASQAQYQLASMYMEGRGVKQENRQAAQWYHRAAEQGHKQAQAKLGYMYSKGLGLTQNDAEALNWYRKAAEQGVMTAQYNIAYMYANAQGIKKNYPQAAFWYKKAAEQGDADAQNNLGKLYELGLGVSIDIPKAKALYRQAASQGHQGAKINQLMLDQ